MTMIYIVFASVWLIGCLWICSYWGERIHKLKNSPKCTTHNRHCLAQASEFGQFLGERGEDMDVKERCYDSESYKSTFRDIFLGESAAMFVLIRKCHLQGCEIVLRQMGEDDLPRMEDRERIIKEYRTGDFRRK